MTLTKANKEENVTFWFYCGKEFHQVSGRSYTARYLCLRHSRRYVPHDENKVPVTDKQRAPSICNQNNVDCTCVESLNCNL